MVGGSETRGPEQGPGSKTASSSESAGGRLRFTVDLRPGETTIVSWKKLLKEAKLSNSNRPECSLGPSIDATRNFATQPPPSVAPSSSKQETGNEQNDSQAQAGPNRLSNVIERIERMYAGNGSSDEEDLVLDNVPDDDEYDTEDSFIDDTELDDYFQVDNSAIKHDGFFVNRGKLERTETIVSTDQQPKKRRRKDLTKGSGSDDGHNPHKVMKMGNKSKKATPSIQISSTSQCNKDAIPNVPLLDQDAQANTAEISFTKTVDVQVNLSPSRLQNGNVIRQDMDTNQHTPGVLPNLMNKRKESGIQDTSPRRSTDKKSHKAALIQKKEGSSTKPKSTMLEKAIRELEKIVAEFRPPATDTQDPDIASQAVKRRLPPEIKQKLAKVARIAQAGFGKVPKDVINHLMSIVGHLMHISTLKRNLKAMASVGLSAKPEKDERIEKIKHEVKEMIKSQILCMKSKEVDPEEKKTLIHRYSMDDELESKICDLYDFFVEKMEEDSGSRVKELYEELALLWPSGIMHADGIERALRRAKERKGLFSRQTDLGRKKKKDVDSGNVYQATNFYDKLLSGSRGRMLPPHAQPREQVKRKPDPEVAEAQLQLEKLAVSAREERPSQRKHLVNRSNARPPAPSGPST